MHHKWYNDYLANWFRSLSKEYISLKLLKGILGRYETTPHNRDFLCKLSLMLTTLLDVNHDNDVYYNNKEIMINGSNYIFKNKIVRVVTWDFLLNLMPELKIY